MRAEGVLSMGEGASSGISCLIPLPGDPSRRFSSSHA